MVSRGIKQMAIGLQLRAEGMLISTGVSGRAEPSTPEEESELTLPDELADALRSGHISLDAERMFENYLKETVFPAVSAAEGMDLRVCVTVPKLFPDLWEKLPAVFERLGVPRRQFFLQDYLSSFFYYAVSQKKELWSGDVALLTFEGQEMVGYLLEIDRSKRPAPASITRCVRQPLTEAERDGRPDDTWDKERDRLLFELLKKLFEHRNVVTCYVVSNAYDRSWAKRSFQYLVQRRHAFQGDNLYARGACYAAMERAGMTAAPELVFLGDDIVRENLGMVLRVRGKRMYYPLVSAGVNWYEAYHECEVIPDEENSIQISSRHMDGGDEVVHVLRLKEFPQRPRRATRLRLTVYFSSPRCAELEAEDLGFGGMFRPSGRTWKRSIPLR